MGCAKGDDANGATAQGKAVSSERKMRPRSGLLAPHVCFGALWHPRRCPIPAFAGPLGPRSGEPPRCAPWHRSPGYDLRRAPYDHPDFTSNVLSEDLFSASLRYGGFISDNMTGRHRKALPAAPFGSGFLCRRIKSSFHGKQATAFSKQRSIDKYRT